MDIAETQLAHLALAGRQQLFFVDGTPRSGTTWLQEILNAHPDVCCRGEAFFGHQMATPMLEMFENWRAKVAAKNTAQFAHTGGFPPPERDDVLRLIGAAIQMALRRPTIDANCKAIGEKTPENLFYFPLFREIFPDALFIAIVRDPRDMLASYWHYFGRNIHGGDDETSKALTINEALPKLVLSVRALLTFALQYPTRIMYLTYEILTEDTERCVTEFYEFLGMTATLRIVRNAITRASFEVATNGRKRGEPRNGAFLRKGIIGDWRETFSPELNAQILRETEWMFTHFNRQV